MKTYMPKRWLQMMFMACFVILTGCGDENNAVTLTARASGILTGRIVDSSTMQPVKGADVALIVNGAKMTTASSSSEDPDLAGTFVFTGVSATADNGPGHTLKITAPGFAAMQTFIRIPDSSDNAPLTLSLGIIALGKGFDLTVIASADGTPVAGVTIKASSYYWPYSPEVTAVTDANGQAVLAGLNQELQYGITSAPFYDGNGSLKYLSASTGSVRYSVADSQAVSLPLVSAMRSDDIQIVASNLLRDGSRDFSYPYLPLQRVLTPNAAIRIVFNYPVTLSEGLSATYVNNLVAANTPDFGKVVDVPSVTASLDPTGTILTITNTAPYLKNQTYTFNGTVMAQVNSLTQFRSLGSFSTNLFFSNRIYVADDTATGLNPLATVQADNYNGTTSATATLVPAQVFVEFPEKVFGTYSVLSTKSGATTTVINSAPVAFNFNDGILGYAPNSSGADNAVAFRVPINSLFLADNSLANTNEVTIFLNVTDAEGNNFSKTVTLPVQ